MPRKLLLLLCFFLLWFHSVRSNQVDSLLHQFQNSSDLIEKNHLLLRLSSEYLYVLPEKELEYASKAYDFYFDNRIKDDSLLAEIYYRKGGSLNGTGQSKLALKSLEKSLKLSRKNNWRKLQSRVLNNIGIIYNELGQFDKAIENYQGVRIIVEEDKDTTMLNVCRNNIGNIYLSIGELDKAEELIKKNLELSIIRKNEHGIAIAYSNLGDIEKKRNNLDLSIQYYNTSLAIVDSLGLNYGRIINKLNLGEVYVEKDLLEMAVKHFEDAYFLAKKDGFKSKVAEAGLGISKWEYENKNYKQSIQFAQEALDYTNKIDSKETAYHLHECLSKNYQALKKYEEALYHQQQSNSIQDSFYNQEKLKTFAELEYKFASKKRETENRFLKEEQLKNQTIIRQQGIISVVVMIFLILLGLASWGLWKQNKQKQEYNQLLEKQVEERTQHLQKSNNQLSAANKELEQFAYITSHDLKEPLRNISGFSSLIQRKLKKGKVEGMEEYLEFITNNTHQMNNLIEDILAYSKVGSEKNSINVSLSHLVNQAKNDLQLLLLEKKGRILYKMPSLYENAVNIFLPAQLSLVFKNLIENGIKYNKSQDPTIKIGYYEHQEHFVLTFKDNGFGIEKEYQQKVFEMFKRLHNRGEYQGSGIGLSICQKVVQTLKGSLKIISSNKNGTIFELKIPMKKEVDTNQENNVKEELLS